MRVFFYNNKSDYRKLSKILESAGSAECALKEGCDILYPALRLAKVDLPNYANTNYMYIPTFGRYYCIKIRAITGDMIEIETLKPDPLMSFANGIRSLTCTITRQEYRYNDYYVDNELGIRQTKMIQWVNLGTFDAGKGIYLTVDGGTES